MLHPSDAFVYPFFYTAARRDWQSEPPRTNMRDALAVIEIQSALLELGLARPGETILNMPPKKAPRSLLPWEQCYEIDLSFVRPGGMLLACTRPPISDWNEWEEDRKKVEAGNTRLERRIFFEFIKYLPTCCRSHLLVSEAIAAVLDEPFRNRRESVIAQKNPSRYLHLNGDDGWSPAGKDARSPVFGINTRALYEDGPGLYCFFGMDSISTLAWAWKVRHEMPHLLEKPGFSFFELIPGALPERPTDHRWAADWGIECVVEGQLPY